MITIHLWNPYLVESTNGGLLLSGDAKVDSKAIEAWEDFTRTSVSSYIQVIDKAQLDDFLFAVINEFGAEFSYYPELKGLIEIIPPRKPLGWELSEQYGIIYSAKTTHLDRIPEDVLHVQSWAEWTKSMEWNA